MQATATPRSFPASAYLRDGATIVGHAPNAVTSGGLNRNQVYDLVRIGFALLVILSHAAEISDGNKSREPLTRLFHNGMTFGLIGVDGFFLLSGYLILANWLTSPNLTTYLQKRILRIVPGYVVAVTASTLILGVVAPATPDFFTHLFNAKFLRSIFILGSPVTPPLFPCSTT